MSGETSAKERVLMMHSYYRQRGGEDGSFEIEVQLLRDRGHEVIAHSVRNDDFAAQHGRIGQALNTLWNHDEYRRVLGLVREVRPSVVHVQNTFPALSPAVYRAAHRLAPVVETIRNYRPVCVNALLFRDGRVCEDCVGTVPWRGVLHRCYQDSTAASAAVAATITGHRLLGTWHRSVDRYIVLNDQAQRVLDPPIPAEKMRYRPNTIWPEPPTGDGAGGHALFVGRLAPEKGIGTLLRAWQGFDMELVVCGDGELASDVSDVHSVRYEGRVSSERVLELIGSAVCLVFPSEWYEGFPRVILEAFACGTPVAAAGIGAAAELVSDDETGAVFNPGDSDGLRSAVERVRSSGPGLRQSTRATYDRKYSADIGYDRLIEIYRSAIAEWQSVKRSGAISLVD